LHLFNFLCCELDQADSLFFAGQEYMDYLSHQDPFSIS
jgi:hypothetical protein